MTQNGMSAEGLAALRASVVGPVLTPGDPGYEKASPSWHGLPVPDYDEARKIWNAKFDRRPR